MNTRICYDTLCISSSSSSYITLHIRICILHHIVVCCRIDVILLKMYSIEDLQRVQDALNRLRHTIPNKAYKSLSSRIEHVIDTPTPLIIRADTSNDTSTSNTTIFDDDISVFDQHAVRQAAISVSTSTSISTSKQSGFTVLYSPYTHTSNTSYSTSSLLPDEPTAKKQKSTASTSTSSSSSYTATTTAATALHQQQQHILNIPSNTIQREHLPRKKKMIWVMKSKVAAYIRNRARRKATAGKKKKRMQDENESGIPQLRKRKRKAV